MQSIRARLGTGLFVTLVILFLLQLSLVSYAIRHLTEEFVLTRLAQDSDSLLAVVEFDADGRPRVFSERLAHAYQQPFSGFYFHLNVDTQDFHSRSLWDADLEFPPVAVGSVEVQYVDGPLDQQLMMHVSAVRKQGHILQIALAQDITDLNSDVRELQLAYGAISLLAMLILVSFQSATLRWGLAPAERARMQLQAMERGQLTRLDEQAPQEIQPLVQEVNRLLDLLSQRLQRSRNALGNLAHALKTPLTVMTQVCDDADLRDKPVQVHEMQQQIENMRNLVERELKRARLAAGGGSGARFKPEEDATMLAATMEKIYAHKGLRFEVDIEPDLTTSLDREDMLELLGNLLDNASKWAESVVSLRICLAEAVLEMQVEDDGPGVAAADIQQLSERGVRVDEATLGHGLGLAIVSDAVDHYGGKVEMGRSPKWGGFQITVTIPLSQG
jgi:signal transduction histidine kinase